MRVPPAISAAAVRRVAILALIGALQACSLEPDFELTLEVDSSDPAVVEQTEGVLAARFDEFRPTLISRRSSIVEGSTIRFTFKNGAPEPKILEYLYATPGHLRAALVTDRFGAWFTDQDVTDARVVYRDSIYALQVRLTPAAGERVLRLTTENQGQVVAMTLDGDALMEARINGAFGDRFEIANQALDAERALVLTVILRTGALPADVRAAARDVDSGQPDPRTPE
jgi:preprotein translocase subunit SecD